MGYYLRNNIMGNRIKIKQHNTQPLISNRSEDVYAANRKVTDLLKEDSWRGRRCFIIGGGESLKDFDYSQLNGELTIGINKVFMYYDPTLLYSMDTRFYGWIRQGVLSKFDNADVVTRWNSVRAPKLFLAPHSSIGFDPSIYLVRRSNNEGLPNNFAEGIWGGDNSGFGALVVAMLLGANPIYLLGYDMQCKMHSHFHKGYPEQSIERTRQKVERFRKTFERFAEAFRARGCQIVNLNPDSALKCFEFDTINNVIGKR